MDIDENTHGKNFIVIDFYATWCKPCKAFSPEFDRMSKKYEHVLFVKVDADNEDCESLMEKYEIGSLPTFLLFQVEDKTPFQRLVGTKEGKLENLLIGTI
jgi:thioredoxin 1